jgi:Uma2 family endonuclease
VDLCSIVARTCAAYASLTESTGGSARDSGGDARYLDRMVTPPRKLHRYTYAQYVAIERESTTKHEFLDGEIYAMAGGTEDHSALAANIITALNIAIGDRPCRIHTSDLRIYVESAGLATFPDGAVICGSLQQHPPSPDATALNPIILVEVTSDSSEEYDTTTKLDIYRTIPTLREYIVVSHRERRISVHRRDEHGAWSTRVAIATGRIAVESLGAEVVVDVIYRNSAIT